MTTNFKCTYRDLLSSGIDTSTITSFANETEQKFAAITCGYKSDDKS